MANTDRKDRIPEERYAAAKVLYESNPTLKAAEIAELCGMGIRSLQQKIARDKEAGIIWNRKLTREMKPEGQEVMEKYMGKLSDYGLESADPEEKAMVTRELAVERIHDMQAKIIEKHRQELGIVRDMVYKSYQGKKAWEDDHECKKAKIYAETLRILHDSERRAWGINAPPSEESKLTIVIERE